MIQKPCITETRRVCSAGTFRFATHTYRAIPLREGVLPQPRHYTRWSVGLADDGSVYLRDSSGRKVADAVMLDEQQKDVPPQNEQAQLKLRLLELNKENERLKAERCRSHITLRRVARKVQQQDKNPYDLRTEAQDYDFWNVLKSVLK
jgi:hypothetical protein